MLSHVFIGVADFSRGATLYGRVLPLLGLVQKFSDPVAGWAGWMMPGVPRPLFVIGRPYDGRPPDPGNGHMVALLAPSRAAVDEVHGTALALGGSCEGPPGLRPHYHPHYYGAYFRDPDGNKICVCCHDPVTD